MMHFTEEELTVMLVALRTLDAATRPGPASAMLIDRLCERLYWELGEDQLHERLEALGLDSVGADLRT